MIAHGVPRYTADVDATVSAPGEPLERIFEVFVGRRIVPRIDGALAFARERQVLLLRHEPSGVDLDVSLASLPFEVEAIRRSETRDYAGVTIRIPRPDDLVIYKLVAARPRDHEDVERLLLLHGSSLSPILSSWSAAVALADVAPPVVQRHHEEAFEHAEHQYAVRPPSTRSVCPVMYDARSPAR